MTRTIKTRVTQSFKDSPHEDITKYLEWLRATMDTLSQHLRRTIGLVLILMAAFGLINASPKTTITIGSFKLAGGSIVAIFIPAIVSFLLYQATADSSRLYTLELAFKDVFSIWSPNAGHNDLDLWITPSQALYWYITSVTESPINRTWWRFVQTSLEDAISVVVFIGVIAFQVLAYFVLHSTVRHYLVLWVISICIAAFCSTAALLQFIMGIPRTPEGQ